MSIGSYLLNKENLELVAKKSWKFGRAEILQQGRRYYDMHPEDVEEIVNNMRYMRLPVTDSSLSLTLEHIVAHYFEKLFILVKNYEAFWIAQKRIQISEEILAYFSEARRDGKGLFLAEAHFGATYFLALALNVRGITISSVGKFPPPVGPMLRQNMAGMAARYHLGETTFLDLSTAETNAPMEMMSLFLQKKVVSNVFDENNQFCKVHELLGRPIMGGTGMDLILRSFSDKDLIILTPFLERNDAESFTLRVERHYLAAGNIIDSFFAALGRAITRAPEQWYFIRELAESIPPESAA